jgi:hypothetical protein
MAMLAVGSFDFEFHMRFFCLNQKLFYGFFQCFAAVLFAKVFDIVQFE